MKGTGFFLAGYAILAGGVVAALWKTGVLASIGGFWIGVGITIAVGLGIMIAVSLAGVRGNIEIKR